LVQGAKKTKNTKNSQKKTNEGLKLFLRGAKKGKKPLNTD
jgi:hypothetical protein